MIAATKTMYNGGCESAYKIANLEFGYICYYRKKEFVFYWRHL